MSDLTDWITAIGTAGAAVGTVATVIVALQLARQDTRRRERQAQLHQAEQITAWLLRENVDPDDNSKYLIPVVIQNASEQLVYDVVANLVSIQGAFRETAVGNDRPECRVFPGQVPPGRHEYKMAFLGRGMFLRFGVELAFRDAAGRYWLRRGDGRLEEIVKTPLALYEIDPPVPWESP